MEKIPRFKNENPRDLGITSSSVESLNAAIVKKPSKIRNLWNFFNTFYILLLQFNHHHLFFRLHYDHHLLLFEIVIIIINLFIMRK